MLYVVSTPIGNLKDITLRALEVLKSVDVILAEDTRVTRKLLEHYAIKAKIISCHEHNEAERIEQVSKWLDDGQSVALVSDAGTPLISDPGYKLVRELRAKNYAVTAVPGVSALITALSISGLPSDQFQFCGFLPAKSSNRKKVFESIKHYPGTTIFYESVHRIEASLKDLSETLGLDREVTLARELTKQYETVLRDQIQAILTHIQENPEQTKGEYVLLIGGHKLENETNPNLDMNTLLSELLNVLPIKQAAKTASNITGVKKNKLYEMALAMREGKM